MEKTYQYQYHSGTIQAIKNLFSFILPLSFLIGLILFHFRSSDLLFLTSFLPTTTISTPATAAPPGTTAGKPPCSGRYIYIQQIPDKFNVDLLRECHNLSVWTDVCPFVANSGIGELISENNGDLLPVSAWYATNQFTLEVIFHERMKQYDCLTNNPTEALAIYIPYYVGLDVGRYLWDHSVSERDSLLNEMTQWLRSSPEWSIRGGRDHFTVSGRTTYDMRRAKDEDSHWGSKFMLIPEIQNMTVLDIESNLWNSNEFGIPYPSYFHPSKKSDILAWQEKVRHVPRPYLFSFAGARRNNQASSAIRDRVINQCDQSAGCKLLDCNSGKCRSANTVMKLFQDSMFCVQPQGDTLTRKSLFDSMIAGCIPVFFHPGSAYEQYKWHLSRNYTKYSVYIPEEAVREGRVKIQDVLLGYSEDQVKKMREEVIKMIPRLVYNDPREKLDSIDDAFDVAINGVIERMKRIRVEVGF
ncbi:hypothetical protein LUZ60_015278 [Juncus effusus]|nr:hypothetical protein LUZ60_015278 [Juncus effusus]